MTEELYRLKEQACGALLRLHEEGMHYDANVLELYIHASMLELKRLRGETEESKGVSEDVC